MLMLLPGYLIYNSSAVREHVDHVDIIIIELCLQILTLPPKNKGKDVRIIYQ